ncbi:Neuropeptide F receptor [Nymphon striatum]|nr:Neuropeptide F receptor [Nymphon striatum]
MNVSDEDIDRYNAWVFNRAIKWERFAPILVIYCFLIFIGAIGNLMVCVAVIRKPQMKTARNVLIVNLAVSDIILCLITMPFSLIEIITKHWTLGSILCKTSGMLQAVSIFVSTTNITAIAVDRYKLIMYPTRNCISSSSATATVVFIWVLSILMACPLFIFRNLKHNDINLPGLKSVDSCWEDWPIEHGRAIYSVCTMVFQYLFPISALIIIHFRICNRLENRLIQRLHNNSSRTSNYSAASVARISRKRKTNQLLIAIACIFAMTWLPLNILNLVSDFGAVFENRETFNIVFAICHMIGMTSACSNPILYGWLNENFQKEFVDIFRWITCKRSPVRCQVCLEHEGFAYPVCNRCANTQLSNLNPCRTTNALSTEVIPTEIISAV